MYRTQPDCGNTNVSVTRDIDSGAGTRVVCTVAIDHKNEMRWLRIRRWWRHGRGHGAELISASCTDQQKNENGEHAGQTPHTHRHPNRRTFHVFKMTPAECILEPTPKRRADGTTSMVMICPMPRRFASATMKPRIEGAGLAISPACPDSADSATIVNAPRRRM